MPSAADSMRDFTGYVLDGQYDLIKVLGAGTFGVVYKALDIRASSPSAPIYRAVKIIRKTGRSKSAIATIRREVYLHSAVSSHPGVVTMVDAYDDNQYFYMILDFCPGGDLFGQIVDRRAYEGNDELLKKAFLSLIDAVQACHDEKIAHRDLKPENVLTSKDGSEVYLADFGMATRKCMVEEFGCGTSLYMSPECLASEPYCARTSDIWALGVILVGMISCSTLWETPARSDSGFRKFVEDRNFLFRTMPISKCASDVLLRILTIDPIARISLQELRRAVVEIDTFFRTPLPNDARGSVGCSVDNITTTTPPSTTFCSDISGASSVDWSSRSLVVTPEGSSSSMEDNGSLRKNLETIDWRNGSMAQLLVERCRVMNLDSSAFA